ncbi:M1 family metallopeptidase [Sphingomonas sp.]|jgi:aminopeptidase N|uniref:M1 family metallopeptidase n=1 Tax=Sphingomonas sp. TaxID=28214 RepID=UPI002E31B7AD|nr:M1 family metallopeptidase [Sphingomonas sp.]HEX4693791.1 M1 family metallopeptidase [Sphingomonas sp.]
MKLAAAAVALTLTTAVPALAAGARLPTDVAPIAYDITIDPNAQAMSFTGSETVTVNVRKATRTIVLNAADLQISRATIDGRAVTFKLDNAAQQLTLTLPAAAKAGLHTIAFAWTGKINESAAGFFAIDYTNDDGSKARMLATQFEAPDARRFAPMWDEPSFKAKFTLHAVAPKGQLAFSNMPALVTKRTDGTQLYNFRQSPVMSSYLLFLGMGDMERKTVMSGKTEIGVITRKGVSDQGDYALASAKRLLAYYNDYFGQPYPLPKLDMIAGPGTSQFFGAMENWGAIFYFEPELLFDKKRSTESDKQRIFVVVAHEMAHQWFGDLVTMSWWDDLWLNEGFASWMENKSSEDLNPDWFARESAVAFDREAAIGADATAATHPIIRHVETVDQIGQAFDSITYQKGEAVIRMIESTLGPDKFRAGIRRYMAKYKYGNTETDMLWSELESASGMPVKGFAHDFTLQGGVPMITVTDATCSGGQTTVMLDQGRFGLDAASKKLQLWQVPLRIATIGGAVTTTEVKNAKPYAVAVAGCEPVVVNLGKGSYARIRYGAPAHAALVRAFGKLSLADQLGTLGDDFALALSGDQDFSTYAATLDAVGGDANPLEWSMVSGELGSLAGLYRDTPLQQRIEALAIAKLGPVLAKIGYEQREGESPLVTNLREGLVGRLGAAGDPDVLTRARAYFAKLKTDPQAIPPAIRQPILGTFAVNATSAEWEDLLALTKVETNPVVKNGYIRLLGAARDPALAARALELIKGDVLTAQQKPTILRAVAGGHPDMAFDFAVANAELVNSVLEASTRAGFIVSLGAGSNDPAMPGKITAYAEKNLPEAARGGAKRALSSIAVRKAVADRLRPGVTSWAGQ